MPAPVWSLDIAGVVKTLAQWRVSGVTLSRANLAGDQLTFTAPRRAFTDAPLLAYGQTIKLLRDAVPWFIGTSQTIPESATAGDHAQTYTCLSPWRWLAQNVFQQPWYNGTVYTSHIITDGTAGNIIKAVLDYAIAQGAPLAYTAADLAQITVVPPRNEFTEKTCAQVITEQLHFAPDTVVWFDYSTGVARLRFQKRGTLPAVALRMAGLDDDTKTPVASAAFTARPDLQIPSAKINFEVIEEVDGEQFLRPLTDIWPPGATGREDGAFNATLTIQGRSTSTLQATIYCEAIDANSVEWWKSHVPGLDSSLVDVLAGPISLEHVNRSGVVIAEDQRLPRELMQDGGGIAPWMGLNYQVEVIRARFLIETYSIDEATGAPSEAPIRTEEREFSVELVTTDAPAGGSTYTTTATEDTGDPVPVGLAQFLYNSLSELHWSGGVTLQQSQCDAVVNLGHVINLHGARAEHQTMRALVQEVVFDIDTGVTRAVCGPPRHLGLSDLLALLQRFRVRRRWTNPDTQDTGALGEGEGGQVELPRATGGANSTAGASIPELFTVLGDGGTIEINGQEGHVAVGAGVGSARVTGGTIELNKGLNTAELDGSVIELDGPAAKVELSGPGSVVIDAAAAAGHPMRIQAMKVCVGGVTKNALFLCSDIF